MGNANACVLVSMVAAVALLGCGRIAPTIEDTSAGTANAPPTTSSSPPDAPHAATPPPCAPGSAVTNPDAPPASQTCAPCEAGAFCAGGHSPPVPCAEGTWDDDASAATACVAWSTCRQGTFETAAGTATTDRTCACPPGAYCDDSIGIPMPCPAGTWNDGTLVTCAPWSTTCSPGQVVTAEPSATHDRACSPCPGDSYTTTANATSCTPRTVCPVGTYVSTPATPTSDRSCAVCPAGLFAPHENTEGACFLPATKVFAGLQNTCAVLADGSVRCWGRNDSGQVGDGTTTLRTRPSVVDGLVGGVKRIFPLDGYTAALRDDGTVVRWGAAYDGTPWHDVSLVPTPVPELANLVDLDTDDQANYAVFADGHVAWFGNGWRLAYRSHSQGVEGLVYPTNALSLAATSNMQCYVRADHTLWCTGYGSVPNLVDVSKVVLGDFHACALHAGHVTCWGSWNLYGTLGVPGISATSGDPKLATTAIDLVSGNDYACALLADGTVQCWGRLGAHGESFFEPTPVLGLSEVTSVTANWTHTCALRSDGSTWCWGYNDYGQLGDGTTTSSTIPIPVAW